MFFYPKNFFRDHPVSFAFLENSSSSKIASDGGEQAPKKVIKVAKI